MVIQENRAAKAVIPAVLYAVIFISVVKLRPLILHDLNVSLAVLIGAYCLLGGAGIYLFRENFRKGISEWKEHFTKSLLWLIGGYIAGIILETMAYYPRYLLYPDYEGMNDSNISIAAKLLPVPLFIVAAGILGPIAEETFFRFILVDKLRKKIPAFICVILSSALFMAWHMHALTLPELLENLPKFISGLVFSVIMLRSENPTIPVLLHVFGNTIAITAQYMNGAA